MPISHFYTGFPAIPSRKMWKTQPTLHLFIEIEGPEIEILKSENLHH